LKENDSPLYKENFEEYIVDYIKTIRVKKLNKLLNEI